jgi:D-alanyl-D-alanine carboxypeptidase/D-alanyl-D-alanine-endopeptidase (penicillin-binding protein 4)
VAHLDARVTNPQVAGLAGVVADDSGRHVWSRRRLAPVMPASTVKIVTAITVLDALGAGATISTPAYLTPGGRVILVGAGDPMLDQARLRALAQAAADAVRAARPTTPTPVVSVGFDDSLFAPPTRPTGWPAGYWPTVGAPVRPLVVDGRDSLDTAADAARVFARLLAEAGLQVSGTPRRMPPASWPEGTVQVGSVASAPVGAMVTHMLSVSDNDVAEGLLRLAAVRTGRPGTWAGGRAAQLATLHRYAVPTDGVRLYDGSGLSRSDRLTAQALVRLLRVASTQPAFAPTFAQGMPVAGVSGSLRPARSRFVTAPSSCAAGRLVAKTGTLTGSEALAGWTLREGAPDRYFAFVVPGRPTSLPGKRALDGLAATVTGCW